ncbi:MAG TPA: hypothetical protein VF834_09345 [Streptosporangiaceae bacterium]
MPPVVAPFTCSVSRAVSVSTRCDVLEASLMARCAAVVDAAVLPFEHPVRETVAAAARAPARLIHRDGRQDL